MVGVRGRRWPASFKGPGGAQARAGASDPRRSDLPRPMGLARIAPDRPVGSGCVESKAADSRLLGPNSPSSCTGGLLPVSSWPGSNWSGSNWFGRRSAARTDRARRTGQGHTGPAHCHLAQTGRARTGLGHNSAHKAAAHKPLARTGPARTGPARTGPARTGLGSNWLY